MSETDLKMVENLLSWTIIYIEIEEELLMKVKEESEKAGLKFNIKNH